MSLPHQLQRHTEECVYPRRRGGCAAGAGRQRQERRVRVEVYPHDGSVTRDVDGAAEGHIAVVLRRERERENVALPFTY